MPLVVYLVAGWALVASLIWLGLYMRLGRQLAALPHLEELRRTAPEQWPTVSVLVPARNEVDDLEEALESLRNQDYPDLEIVVVDDRSTDGTGALLDELAARDPRLRAVHVDELPDGWLGKVHALQRALECSSGEFLLLTDADVEHGPETVRTAVEVALGEEADHLTCMPWMRDHDFWTEVAFAAFITSGFQAVAVTGVHDPDSVEPMGIGAFNLVRRTTFERAGGFEPLRMEVADDTGVAQLIQSSGGVSRIVRADDRLAVTWYDSLPDMVAGLEKNIFGALGHYSYLRVAGFSVAWALLFFGPLAGIVIGGPVVAAVSAAAVGLHPIVSLVAARTLDRPYAPFLLRFLGQWIMFYVLLRSAYKCWRRGGIDWRGTTYPVEQLRRHQRVQF